MDPKHTQALKVQEGLARLLSDNAGLALVTNLVNWLMWELVIWSSLGSTVVLSRYACLGLATLLRWRTVLAHCRWNQNEVVSGSAKTALPAWHASCTGHV
jgi:hypothetical protein